MKKLFCLAFFALSILTLSAQDKTYAFFMLGNYAYAEWEKLEFELNANGGDITYSYAKKPNGIKLKNLGIKYVGQYKVLMVQIPGSAKIYYLNPDPNNKRLQFKSSDNKYNKWLPLGYEGPVNGIGTYCERCANEPEDAFEIVNSFLTN